MSAASAPEPETSTGPDVVIGVDTRQHTHMAVALSANGGWLGKDDTIDAEATARSFIARTPRVIPKAGDDLVELIRMLKVVKDSAIENHTAALNQLHAIVVTAPAALRERLQRPAFW